MRTTALDRGKQHLTDGRLILTSVNGDTITAQCRGSGEMHSLGHDLERGWWCTCPVTTDRCSHLHALRLVTIRHQNGPR
jgi:uncharacterized Zn finger protein